MTCTGCSVALRDRGVVYTELGLTAAAEQWDDAYHERLKHCKASFEPETPEAETCFGEWFDADAKVDTALRSAIALLRTYWTARAAGESDPGWRETSTRVAALIRDLPPVARQYFERIKGIKP